MPNTPYAKVKMVVDGSPAVYGGQIVTGGNVVQLLGEDTSSWDNALWEIYEYPEGFACPAGWVNINGVYTSYDDIPPSFTLANSSTLWGKYFFRLTVDGGLLDGVFMGVGSDQPLVDEASALSVLSPNANLHDVGNHETNQFDSFRQYIGELKKTLRLIDSIVLSGGAGEINSGQSIGTGAHVYKEKSGLVLRFRSIVQGANVVITENADDVTIAATGEANNGTNVGTGAGTFKDKSGVNLRFRSLLGGAGITITQNADDIQIDASGSTPGGSVAQVQYNDGSGGFAGATNVKILGNDLVVGTNLGPVADSGSIRGALGTSFSVRNTDDSNNRQVFETYAISGGGSAAQFGASGTTSLSKVFEQVRIISGTKTLISNSNLSANVEISNSEIALVGRSSPWANLSFYNTGSSPGGSTFGSGVGVFYFGEADTNPSSNPTDGIVLYVDNADNKLKYRQVDGTVIVLDGSGGGGGTAAGSAGQVQYTDGAGAFLGAANVLIAGNDLVVGNNLGPVSATGAIRGAPGMSIRARNFANDQDIALIDYFDDGVYSEVAIGTNHLGTLVDTVERVAVCATNLFYVYIDDTTTPLTVGKVGTSTYATFINSGNNFGIVGTGFPTEAEFGGGSGVFLWGNATTVPSTNPTTGVIAYVESNLLKYRKPDGTVIVLDGSAAAGGSSGQMQYNNGGLLGGTAGVLYDTGSGELKIASTKGIKFRNNADDNEGRITWNVTGARQIIFPDATGVLDLTDNTATLTNKTINVANNTLTATSQAAGDLLRNDGTKFVRFARGSALQVLRVNSGGTDLEWASVSTGSPGGSTTQFQWNNGGAFAGASGFVYNNTNSRARAVNGLEFDNGANILVLDGSPTGSRTVTIPDATTTLVGRDTADALSNKTYIAFGSVPASSGPVRLQNNTFITAATFGGSNQELIGLNASDEVVVGAGGTNVIAGTSTKVKNGATTLHEVATTYSRMNGDYVAFAAGEGSTLPTVGRIRISASYEPILVIRASNGADFKVADYDATNGLTLGDPTNAASATTNVVGSSHVKTKINTTVVKDFDANNEYNLKPRIGSSTPFASEGNVTIDINNANYTLNSAEYGVAFIQITSTSSLTAIRTITLPAPTSGKGYSKFFQGIGGSFPVRLSIGSGSTLDIGPGVGVGYTVFVTSAGVFPVS